MLCQRRAANSIPRVPVIGMLCGNAIAGVSVTLGYVLKELEYVPSLLRTAKADTVAARTETRRRHTSRLARRASRPAVLSP
jgi:hypothetical protein